MIKKNGGGHILTIILAMVVVALIIYILEVYDSNNKRLTKIYNQSVEKEGGLSYSDFVNGN